MWFQEESWNMKVVNNQWLDVLSKYGVLMKTEHQMGFKSQSFLLVVV